MMRGVVRVPNALLTRRAMLIGLSAGAAVIASPGLAGCGLFDSGPAVPTVVPAPELADPITGLIATTRLHILRLDAAIAAAPAQAPLLTNLRDDRQQHLEALEAEFARLHPPGTGTSSAPPSAPATPSTAVTLPDSPEAIISSVRGDAATAQVQFTDAVASASRYRAALFGSIAASLATHRAALA